MRACVRALLGGLGLGGLVRCRDHIPLVLRPRVLILPPAHTTPKTHNTHVGTGLVGLACAALGAEEVVLTDLPYTLRNLEANARRNEVGWEVGGIMILDVSALGLLMPVFVWVHYNLKTCRRRWRGAAAGCGCRKGTGSSRQETRTTTATATAWYDPPKPTSAPQSVQIDRHNQPPFPHPSFLPSSILHKPTNKRTNQPTNQRAGPRRPGRRRGRRVAGRAGAAARGIPPGGAGPTRVAARGYGCVCVWTAICVCIRGGLLGLAARRTYTD